VLTHLLDSKDVVVRLNATRVLDSIEEEDHKNTIPDKKLIKLFDHECEYFKDTLLCIKTFEKALTSVGNRLSGSNGKRDEEQAARDHLKTHLETQAEESLETIFNLLSLKYKESDMEVVLMGIRNDTEESKINAIEFLENLLAANLRSKLMPLLEYSFLGNTESELEISDISEDKCLLKLLNYRGADTKIQVLTLMQFVQNNNFVKPVKKLLTHKNQKIRSLAKKYLTSFNPSYKKEVS
jgi:AAA family ATP:ADP antiporter